MTDHDIQKLMETTNRTADHVSFLLKNRIEVEEKRQAREKVMLESIAVAFNTAMKEQLKKAFDRIEVLERSISKSGR
jgi:hypothetical protein